MQSSASSGEGGSASHPTAVAVSGSHVVATLDDIAKVKITQTRQSNNTALKWFRDTNEDPPGFPTTWSVDLTHTDPVDIGVLLPKTKKKGGVHNMAYKFQEGAVQPWSWRQMLAGFDMVTRSQIMGFGENTGVVSIRVCAIKGSCDHKRHYAAVEAGAPYSNDVPVPIWDFIVERADGSEVRFRTQQTSKKVEVCNVTMAQRLPEPPMKGRGGSDGPGTYRRKLEETYPGEPKPAPAAVAASEAAGSQGPTALAAKASIPTPNEQRAMKRDRWPVAGEEHDEWAASVWTDSSRERCSQPWQWNNRAGWNWKGWQGWVESEDTGTSSNAGWQ